MHFKQLGMKRGFEKMLIPSCVFACKGAIRLKEKFVLRLIAMNVVEIRNSPARTSLLHFNRLLYLESFWFLETGSSIAIRY